MCDVANDGDVDLDYFVDRRWINVDMRLFRMRAELFNHTGDPVIKACADVDH